MVGDLPWRAVQDERAEGMKPKLGRPPQPSTPGFDALGLHRKLCAVRESTGLKLREVAEKSGIPLSTLASYEVGERTEGMSLRALYKILGVYGITLEQFFAEVQA